VNTWWKRAVARPVLALGRAREQRHFSEPPILIGGCARPGTTLLAAILSAHPHIWVVPRETWAFVDWQTGADGRPQPTRPERLYHHVVFRHLPAGARRWCEKSPSNVMQIGNILAYFGPRVRVVHIVRDARDVCLSVHPTRREAYWVRPTRWVRDVSAGLAFRDHPQVHTLTYEALVDDTAGTIAAVLRFLDEPDTPEIADWHAHARLRVDRALDAGLRPIFASSVGKWREPRHAARLAEVLATPGVQPLLDQLGYA
jgi:Sulfotransferase family